MNIPSCPSSSTFNDRSGVDEVVLLSKMRAKTSQIANLDSLSPLHSRFS